MEILTIEMVAWTDEDGEFRVEQFGPKPWFIKRVQAITDIGVMADLYPDNIYFELEVALEQTKKLEEKYSRVTKLTWTCVDPSCSIKKFSSPKCPCGKGGDHSESGCPGCGRLALNPPTVGFTMARHEESK